MSAADELGRALAEREVDVAPLVRQAEADARADVVETLRGLFAEDLLRRVTRELVPRRLVALAGVADGLRPLVLDLSPGDLEDEARLETLVRAHNGLLLDALRDGAVVPFRFGTTFEDRAALEAWIDRRRVILEGELGRLRGAAEWSVEIVGRTPSVDAADYLEARLATAIRPDVRSRLAAASEETTGNAYLVATAKLDEFAAAIEALEQEGHELRVTGPWPPYSFARLP